MKSQSLLSAHICRLGGSPLVISTHVPYQQFADINDNKMQIWKQRFVLVEKKSKILFWRIRLNITLFCRCSRMFKPCYMAYLITGSIWITSNNRYRPKKVSRRQFLQFDFRWPLTPVRALTLAWGPLKPQPDKKKGGFGKAELEKLAHRRATPPSDEILISMWAQVQISQYRVYV